MNRIAQFFHTHIATILTTSIATGCAGFLVLAAGMCTQDYLFTQIHMTLTQGWQEYTHLVTSAADNTASAGVLMVIASGLLVWLTLHMSDRITDQTFQENMQRSRHIADCRRFFAEGIEYVRTMNLEEFDETAFEAHMHMLKNRYGVTDEDDIRISAIGNAIVPDIDIEDPEEARVFFLKIMPQIQERFLATM